MREESNLWPASNVKATLTVKTPGRAAVFPPVCATFPLNLASLANRQQNLYIRAFGILQVTVLQIFTFSHMLATFCHTDIYSSSHLSPQNQALIHKLHPSTEEQVKGLYVLVLQGDVYVKKCFLKERISLVEERQAPQLLPPPYALICYALLSLPPPPFLHHLSSPR